MSETFDWDNPNILAMLEESGEEGEENFLDNDLSDDDAALDPNFVLEREEDSDSDDEETGEEDLQLSVPRTVSPPTSPPHDTGNLRRRGRVVRTTRYRGRWRVQAPYLVPQNTPGPSRRNVSSLQGKNGHRWSTVEPTRRGRPISSNLVSRFPGARGPARNVTTPLEAWKLLFDNTVIQEIILRTNQEIERRVGNNENRLPYQAQISENDLSAVIGLLYLCGAQKNSTRNVKELWSPTGYSLFRASMSLSRFQFLVSCLRFDDKTTRQERREHDKLAPIRTIWNLFINNCTEMYTPFEHCTIDEQLLGFRGQCPFRIYMKSKPDKYGMKIVMMNDPKTSYMISAIPYVGKVTTVNNEDVPSYYVRELSLPIHGTNRNITTDNWFSSVPLFKNMLENYSITMVGTLRKNKAQIPLSFKENHCQDTSLFAYDNELTMVSYCPKPRKNVILLSTMHHNSIVDEATKKPEIVLFYNSTKGGTDTFDKLCHTYTTARPTRRWPMRFFCGMLDQSGVNSMVLYNLNTQNPVMKRRLYLNSLAESLIKPLLMDRLSQPTLRRNLKSLITDILNVPAVCGDQMGGAVAQVSTENKQRRCFFCDRNTDRKTKQVCVTCRKPMCDTHRTKKCLLCAD